MSEEPEDYFERARLLNRYRALKEDGEVFGLTRSEAAEYAELARLFSGAPHDRD